MLDLQYLSTFWGSVRDRVSRFNFASLVPRLRVDKYEYASAGFEFTWKGGMGIGLGLGVVDLWFGWPRQREEDVLILDGVEETFSTDA